MGFKDVKKQVIDYLLKDQIEHEQRNAIGEKNLLATGLLSKNEVIDLIKRTTGNQYASSVHHFDPDTMVHILKPVKNGVKWYIKFYFLDGAIFISVHESETDQ